jgi:hypothetical protein
MRLKTVLFLLTLMGWFQAVVAQDASSPEIKPNHYLSVAGTLTAVHYKDEVTSPLTYNTSGLPLGLEVSYQNRFREFSGYSRIFYTQQLLNTEQATYNDNPAEIFLSFQFNTSRTWNVAQFWKNRIQYRFGYSGNFHYNHQINDRLQNSAYTFAIWLNGGLANRFEFPFTLNTEKKWWFIRFHQPQQSLRLSWQLNLPLLGVITRPNYAGIRHFANGEFLSNLSREMRDHAEFTSLHNFLLLDSQLELWAPLGNRNQLKLAYQWQGFRFGGHSNPVQSTVWSVMVGLMIRIDSHGNVE